MSLKNGDEIVLIANNPSGGCLRAGDTGIIKGRYIDEDSKNEEYAVEFEFEFSDMHDCNSLVPSERGWFINVNEMVLNGTSIETLCQQKQELLKALRDLNSVKSEPWTDEQRELKLKIGFQVEDILKKYESQ